MSYFHPKYVFAGQHDGEKIYLVIRSHWLFLFYRIMLGVLLLIIYIAANETLRMYGPNFNFTENVWDIISIIKDLYLILSLLILFVGWTMYYLNVQIVTNERIVEIQQHSLLSHTVSELHLSRIQDITSEVDGALQTFFNFGNLYIQTAGETERFVFRNVANPTELEKLISNLCDKVPKEPVIQANTK